MSFGENVRWLRTHSGISQAELARVVWLNRHAVSQSYISRIELGHVDPRLSTVRSIARGLHVKTWQLVAGITENTAFWSGYLALTAAQKREVQRLIEWYLTKGGRE